MLLGGEIIGICFNYKMHLIPLVEYAGNPRSNKEFQVVTAFLVTTALRRNRLNTNVSKF